MNTQQLSKNHQRIIASRLQMIERNILEIKQMLFQKEHLLLSEFKDPLTIDETGVLIEQLEKIQFALAELAKRYQIKFYKKNQRAVLLSRLTTILDIAEDMYSDKLKGYGNFSKDLNQEYNNDIKKLERSIKQTFRVFHDI